MKNDQRAYNYAFALFSLAKERKLEEEIYADISSSLNAFKSDERLIKFLYNPAIAFKTKIDALKNIFKINPLALNFITLLTKNKALSSLSEILVAYKELFDKSKNIERVMVTSAAKLDKEKQGAIKKKLDNLLKKDTVCTFEIEPRLIAGFTVSYGGNLLDGSMKKQLNRLKENLSAI